MKVGNYLRQSKDAPSLDKKEKKSPSQLGEMAVITHKNCPDGCAFSVLMRMMFEDDYDFSLVYSKHELVAKDFERTLHKAKPRSKVILGDIFCTEAEFDNILPMIRKKELSMEVYEHHKSVEWLLALGENEPWLTVTYDILRSASKILYDKYVSLYASLEKYRSFIEATNDRDLWLGKDPHAFKIAVLHQIYGDKRYTERFMRNAILTLTKEESILYNYSKHQERRRKEALLSRITIKHDRDDMKYGVIYGEGNSSDVLNEAIQRYDLEYALLVNLNTQKVSVRSRGKFDCQLYASQYKGGGHKHASGFVIPNFVPPAF